MSQPRKVQSIARGPSSFTPSALPPIQSPMQIPPPPMNDPGRVVQMQFQQPPADPIEESIQDLAMEIYSQLAIAHIQSNQPDQAQFQSLARAANLAAEEYFRALGVPFDLSGPNR